MNRSREIETIGAKINDRFKHGLDVLHEQVDGAKQSLAFVALVTGATVAILRSSPEAFVLEIDEEDRRGGWWDLANCLGVDPDLFFPERGASTKEAKEICRGCVVKKDCLEYALENGEKFGIWGGMSERERRRLRRQRALARKAAAVAN